MTVRSIPTGGAGPPGDARARPGQESIAVTGSQAVTR